MGLFTGNPSNSPGPVYNNLLNGIGNSLDNNSARLAISSCCNIVIASLVTSIFGGIACSYSGLLYNYVGSLHDSLAYSFKTEVIKKTKAEWIQEETNSELARMKRMAGFITEVNNHWCAEILNTCHIDSKSEEHRKILMQDLKVWHPHIIDRHPDPVMREHASIAANATTVLINVLGRIRQWEGCLGQDEDGCLDKIRAIDKTTTLITPNWLYRTFLNMQPTCQSTMDGKTEILNLEQCSHLENLDLNQYALTTYKPGSDSA